MTNPLYALILAGGSGERFWPLSRRARPKQLLQLVSRKDVARGNDRSARWAGPAGTDFDPNECRSGSRPCADLLPDLPPENIVAEPAKRDTAAAVALATVLGGEARSSRHHAGPAGRPRDQGSGRLSGDDADRGPRRGGDGRDGDDRDQADLGLSGLRLHRAGRPVALAGGRAPNDVFASCVSAKNQTRELADSFVQKGNFRWNAGMFVWSVPTVLSEFNRHAPELADFISQVRAPGNWETALRDSLREFAGDFVRLRDHGKGRSRPDGGSEFRLGRRRWLARGRGLSGERRA